MGAPFDSAASSYDEEFQSLPGTARLRRIIFQRAIAAFPRHGSILELNCGTGTDATALGKEGYRVLATDESSAMVRETRNKVTANQLESQVTCRQLGFHELADLNGRRFDGVLSNLGGLNCVDDLSTIGPLLHSLMNPGSIFLAVLLSPFCMWEFLSFGLRGDPKGALRRLSKSGTDVRIHDSPLRVFFHTPGTVEAALSPFFRKKELLGLNVITPPPASVRAYSILRPLMPFLESVEEKIARFPPFNTMGDHYLLELERMT